MKRLCFILMILCSLTQAQAEPVLPGIWKVLSLTDGTTIRAELQGDEFCHFWRSEDGRIFVGQHDSYVETTFEQLTQSAAQGRRARATSGRRARAIQQRNYTGSKKGLIILVNFKDKKFQDSHTKALYDQIANELNFTSNLGFRGSVRDYFLAQSGGLFDLTFDVKGPITLSNEYAHYGENDERGNDKRPGLMVADACRAIASQVNFSDYDWDGNGEVDQVMIIFAGQGENASSDENTIWPHEFHLQYSDIGKRLQLGSCYIDTYACAAELSGNRLGGIGTICHEFTHCLGLPDYYDVDYGGNYGLGKWSLMSGGSHNGSGFCPAGFTSMDKMMCGWIEPIEMTTDTTITAMRPLSEGGEAYLLRNKGYNDEFFLLENRQKVGWDSSLPGNGLLVLHVDYDKTIWEYNEVNSTSDETYSGNTHQRCTIFHADNKETSSDEAGDPYPYNRKDSLTRHSNPDNSLYHWNTDGTKNMALSILDITNNGDNTMSFRLRDDSQKEEEEKPGNDYLFYESFNSCNSTGGNDGLWSGNIANGTLTTDSPGWSYRDGGGANQCARFGSSTASGKVTTPFIFVTDEATITFLAAPWVGADDGTGLKLSVSGLGSLKSGSDATITPDTFNLKQGEWTACQATIKSSTGVKVIFQPDARFFLDEVKVVKGAASAIRTVTLPSSTANRIYTLDGRYVGTDLNSLKPGLYISGGKKRIKK